MKIFRKLFISDLFLTDNEVSEEFRRRHRKAFFYVLLPVCAVLAIAYLIYEDKKHYEWLAPIAGLALLILFFYVMIYYRCPRCASTPISTQFGTTGVLLFPKKCAKCKAPLLPDHKFGQE
jgi:lipopolysaccharide export LptBFGC system permease protein LptF